MASNCNFRSQCFFTHNFNDPCWRYPFNIRKDVNCLYFDPGNVIEMSEKILELFLDTRKRNKIVENNNKLIKKFDSKLIADQLKIIYGKVLF